jgi:hypothetical protein
MFFKSPSQGWGVGTGGTVLQYKCNSNDANMAMNNQTRTIEAGLVAYFGGNQCSNLITKVLPTGANSIAGRTSAKVWVDNFQSNDFVRRHYEITPFEKASTATGLVTLYFTQQEFNDFNSVSTLKLPTAPSDIIGKANLIIEKRDGQSIDSSGLPETYSGSVTYINPIDENIIWNSGANRWEVSFLVRGFSGFFLKALTQYTFAGSGVWSNPANWSDGRLPPNPLPAGSLIVINGSGECVLDIAQTISSGATLRVEPGKQLRVNGNLIRQ